jgi:hypothetical protein
MMTLQSKIEKKLVELAELVGREIIVSYKFGNMGTFHLLENDKHLKQVDFRFNKNSVSLDSREEHDYYYEVNFDMGNDWDKLIDYLAKFVVLEEDGKKWDKLKKYIAG